MGTCLKVYPFASLHEKAVMGCTKIIVDADPNHKIGNYWKTWGPKHHFIVSDTDSWVNSINLLP